jgi:asparagine synthase (glutamine-hydrolysing)
MCGFVAFLSSAKTLPGHRRDDWMRGMLDVIAHRGPDDSGVELGENVIVGFRRLAILDMSPASHQPMRSSDGRILLTFNGEIYNYLELRAELVALGRVFRSSGDSEVLLAAYQQWGESVVDRLRGMFAFCVVDDLRKTVFVARDRFGIKPLFMCQSAEGVLFASELKCVRRSGLLDVKPNLSRFARFLASGRTENLNGGGETFLENVSQVRAGEAIRIDADGSVTRRYYWTPETAVTGREGDWKQIEERFDDAIALHLRSDVPVGVMLSGGIDSTAIACRWISLAFGGRAPENAVQAFSYVSEQYPETTQLNDTIEATGVHANYLTDTSAHSLWDSLPTVMWHHDEPFHSATVLVGHALYGLAKSHGIKVVLSGQGADEVFAGYPSYAENLMLSLALGGRFGSLLAQAKVLQSQGGPTRRQTVERTLRMLRSYLVGTVNSAQLAAGEREVRRSAGFAFLSDDLRVRAVGSAPPLRELPLAAKLRSAIGQGSLPQYLQVEDRNSMAHSIESRVPFLDHPLVELALQLPDERLMWDGWNKIGLREALKHNIPVSVSSRREKFGFATSARDWFSNELHEKLRELLLDGALSKSGWVNMARIERMLIEHKNYSANHSNVLFAAAQTAVWLDLDSKGWGKP